MVPFSQVGNSGSGMQGVGCWGQDVLRLRGQYDRQLNISLKVRRQKFCNDQHIN